MKMVIWMTIYDISNTRVNYGQERGYQIHNYNSWALDQWERGDLVPIQLWLLMNDTNLNPCHSNVLHPCIHACAYLPYVCMPMPMIISPAMTCHDATMPPCTPFRLISVPMLPFGATHCHNFILTLSFYQLSYITFFTMHTNYIY